MSPLQTWLNGFLRSHGAVAGTVHVRGLEVLELRAAVNIPPPVKAATERIPCGKGMAGLAWERDAPVTTCNLATDETGDVRPGAKAVNASAAVAIPIHGEDGQVSGVVGIAYADEREVSVQELALLQREAEGMPR